ncbi:MAG: SDR family NAD(P)-dependent oxidoreductase [Gammaproteobacteria bacterium]|nr:SDR family NAD(P)-dependent oxidoreductase [Gammaproteobacteria bacterium]MDE0514166.1 SDR family NAD(P)-dependent oxidoreductase [Gammaproteobacteria bacterium]
MKLTDNTVLITGGSSGIGLEISKQFLNRNNKVIITGRDEKKLQHAKQQLDGVAVIRNDVSNPDDIEKLYQQATTDFPELNILINNAGILHTLDLRDSNLSAADLTMEIDINLKGTILMNNVFLPLLKCNNNPAIINVSSGLAFVPLPMTPVYCSTKAAIHSYSLSLRAQLRNTGVKVFELAPPLTETEMIGSFNEQDIRGVSVMSVDGMVADFLKGLAKDEYEIRPGLANQLKFMSRFFPSFILRQLSKSVDRLH